MKQLSTLTLVVLLLYAGVTLRAQTDESLDSEFGARLSASLDRKIVKGLRLSLEEEIRLDDNLSAFNRFHTTLGLNYKVAPFLKVGLGYALINGYDADSSHFKAPRHRLMADVTGTLRYGDWQFSLKERLQMTHRTGHFNEYQSPENAWMLKSRLLVKYRGLRRLTPYAYIELRHHLNAPAINATYCYGYNEKNDESSNVYAYQIDKSTYTTLSNIKGYKKHVYTTSDGTYYCDKGDTGWFLDGFNSTYLNRLRGSIGVDYKVDSHGSLNLSLLLDRTIDKVMDANAEGTRLKSYTRQTGFAAWLCAGYEYSF